MSNYFKLKKCLKTNELYDVRDKERLKELGNLEGMSDILKDMEHLFGYESRYVLSSVTRYLRETSYDQQVLLKILKDKIYLVKHMSSKIDAYNGPDLEKLYATYDFDTYQLLFERFLKHYINKEEKEYSTTNYCNVLLGDNKEKLKYITNCLMPSNISKLFELKPEKLEIYLIFLSIRNSNSMDTILEFIEMIDTFERLGDAGFIEALQFVYQDQDAKSIFNRLNFLPSLFVEEENRLSFNSVAASKILRLPEKIQRVLYLHPDCAEIINRFNPIFTELLVDSIRNTSSVQQNVMAELYVNPKFYKRTEKEKLMILEHLRTNGDELEEDEERYQRKVNFILEEEREELFQEPFLKSTLFFICQKDSEEVFLAKKEALENYNGSLEDKSQYEQYLELLQAGLSNQSDSLKAKNISNRSQYLTENSFEEFYQKIGNSSNKDRFMSLFQENTSGERFFSICDVIASEKMWNQDVYKEILNYIDYTGTNEELLFALKMMEQTLIKGSSMEAQSQLAKNLSESLKQTISFGNYQFEVIGDGLLQKQLENGELTYTSPDCKAQIKVKKI